MALDTSAAVRASAGQPDSVPRPACSTPRLQSGSNRGFSFSHMNVVQRQAVIPGVVMMPLIEVFPILDGQIPRRVLGELLARLQHDDDGVVGYFGVIHPEFYLPMFHDVPLGYLVWGEIQILFMVERHDHFEPSPLQVFSLVKFLFSAFIEGIVKLGVIVL